MIFINKNSKNYSNWQIFVRTDKTCPLVSPNIWQDQNLFKNSVTKHNITGAKYLIVFLL